MRRPANPKGRSAAQDLRRRDYWRAKRPRGASEAGGDIIAPPMVMRAPRRSRSAPQSLGMGFGSMESGTAGSDPRQRGRDLAVAEGKTAAIRMSTCRGYRTSPPIQYSSAKK